MKTPKERDNLDLLELVCQLHGRASMYGNKEQHDAYVEARKELESRLQEPKDNWVSVDERLPKIGDEILASINYELPFSTTYIEDGYFRNAEYVDGVLEDYENECVGDYSKLITHWQPLPSKPKDK